MTKRQFDHDPQSVTTAREAAGLSKAALAKRLGCSRSLITEIEGGTRNADEQRIQQIAKVLGCPAVTLRARESGRPAAEAGDGRLLELRNEERSDSAIDVQAMRDASVGGE